ncbi:MAG: GNAT family N-acetyltransferase [Egibacteraceae bacterium]
MEGLRRPTRLERRHIREGFHSGAPELDDWLVEYAWENQQANNATTFVTTLDDRVVGYYSLTVASVAKAEAPERLAKAAPTQIPCLLLARLAVDQSVQGRGVATGLLADALSRGANLAHEVGVRALLVHARDDAARAFSLSKAEFLASPADDLQLLLPMKWILQKFDSSAEQRALPAWA